MYHQARRKRQIDVVDKGKKQARTKKQTFRFHTSECIDFRDVITYREDETSVGKKARQDVE